MKDADPNLLPIPAAWKASVGSILREGNKAKIFTTQQSVFDWEAAFPSDSWDYIRFGAIADALEQEDIQGRKILDMQEEGEVYAFWFYYQRKQLYAKINLLPNGQLILIYSSHLPRKGTEKL
jgi:hypothetical protein